MPASIKKTSSQSPRVDVLVIGGGAAGLMAAGQAAFHGASVCLLEKINKPARKLRITGKGRCNFTNRAELTPFLAAFDRGGKFLRPCFSRFYNTELISFLESIGIRSKVERGGRVFPASERGLDVVDGLLRWCRQQGVLIRPGCPVSSLVFKEKEIQGVMHQSSDSRGEMHFQGAKRVIIASGGSSYPSTGSSGDGFRLAQEAGHTIQPVHPALVPLQTSGQVAAALQGLSLVNCGLKVFIDGKCARTSFGEMLFTHFGVSGPIILSVSSLVVKALHENKTVWLRIDLKPALDQSQLDKRLQRDLFERGKQEMRNLLRGLLPKKLIPVCLDQTEINGEKTGSQLTAKERKRLRLWLKDFQLKVCGHRSFEEAIVTAGGVRLQEVDPRTMSSRLVSGLYFAGEVLDFHADTGGYNLQAAFSTGWVAGREAAASIPRS